MPIMVLMMVIDDNNDNDDSFLNKPGIWNIVLHNKHWMIEHWMIYNHGVSILQEFHEHSVRSALYFSFNLGQLWPSSVCSKV